MQQTSQCDKSNNSFPSSPRSDLIPSISQELQLWANAEFLMNSGLTKSGAFGEGQQAEQRRREMPLCHQCSTAHRSSLGVVRQCLSALGTGEISKQNTELSLLYPFRKKKDYIPCSAPAHEFGCHIPLTHLLITDTRKAW